MMRSLGNGLLFLTLIVTPSIGVISSKATVPLLIISAVAIAISNFRGLIYWPNYSRGAVAGLLLLVAVGLISSIWSIDRAESLRLILPISALLFVGVVFTNFSFLETEARTNFERAIFVGFSAGLVLLIFEVATDSWFYRLSRGFTWDEILFERTGGINIGAFIKSGVVILVMMFWPAATILTRSKRYWQVFAVFVLLFAISFIAGANASMLAILSGLIASVIAFKFPRFFFRTLAAGILLLILTGPFLAQKTLTDVTPETVSSMVIKSLVPVSVANRLITWKFSSDRIAERPILGWGFRGSRNIPGGNEKYNITRTAANGRKQIITRDFYIPLHPHNQIIQVWLELGIIGAVIVGFIGAHLILKAETMVTGNPENAWVAGLISSIIVYDLFSFGAWQNWWIALQFLSISYFLAVSRKYIKTA